MLLTTRRALLGAGITMIMVSHPAVAQPKKKAEGEDAEPATASAKEIEISLAEAVRSALAHHPEVTNVAVETEIARIQAKRVDARFSPVLTVTGFGRRETSYNEFGVAVGGAIPETLENESVGATGSLEGRTTFGGSYQVRGEAQRFTDNSGSPAIAFPDRYQTLASARYTQPLLRGFGFTANRGLIRREELNAELTEAAGIERLRTTVLEVVDAYWSLYYARQEVEIARANQEGAETLRQVVERRVRAGQDSRAALVEVDAAVAERRQAVEAARIVVIDAERRFLGVSYLDRRGAGMQLDEIPVPADPGDYEVKVGSYDEELAIALKNRAEIERNEKAIRLAELDRKIAENGRRMRLDVYGEAGILGVAGEPFVDYMPPDVLVGAFGTSISNLGAARAPYFAVGVILEIPFDNDDRAGAARQASLVVKQRKAEQVRTQVALDIRQAIQRIQVAEESLRVATRSRDLAEKHLEAQERLYKGGGGTLFDVLRAQGALSAARGERVLARAQLRYALSNLEAAKGTLFQSFGVQPKLEAR